VAVEIAQTPAEQKEAAIGEEIRVHDPREGGLGKAEILANRRQRDVHDRHVEHDHQAAEAEHVEGKPAGAIVGDRHRCLSFPVVRGRFRMLRPGR
jgi:hypothetical protein